MSTALIVSDQSASPAVAFKQSTDVAGVIRDFALKRCLTIKGKKYPRVEVWQAIANSYGCVASAGGVEVVEGGVKAIGEVRRISDGKVLATGEGFVGSDEPLWNGRPMFARRAMAQTRSISRACRAAFAFVVPLIDEDMGTTPAEEMEEAEQPERPMKPAKAEVRSQEPETFEGVLTEITEREGVNNGKPWKAWFLTFDKREGNVGTFSETLARAASVLEGASCKVTVKPGRKAGSWELVNIEPAPDDVPN